MDQIWTGCFKVFFIIMILLGGSIKFAGSVYHYEDSFRLPTSSLPPIDVIVVLAGGKGRIGVAGELWFQYWERSQKESTLKVPLLYIAGAGPHATWITVYKQFSKPLGQKIKFENVIIEKQSYNTETNALEFIKSAKKQAWKHLILITSDYHMKRAQIIFNTLCHKNFAYMKIENYSLQSESFSKSNWWKSFTGIRLTTLELIKIIYYQFFREKIFLSPSSL